MQLIANELLNQCRWPEQPPRYAAALREAVIYIVNRYDPVGIVACGTIIRGAPDEASDLDLYVIHGAPWRQRVQKFFGGVPAEMFVNPPVAIRRYFREQHAAGRPLTAHMLATGWIVLSRDGIIETLCREAAEWLDKPVDYPASRAVMDRYYVATLYEDARDVAGKDPAAAGMLLQEAVTMMLRHWFLRNGMFVPRGKELIARLTALDEQLGQAAAEFFQAPSEARWAAAQFIADRTIEARGFFEWETEPEDVTTSAGEGPGR